MENLKSKIEKMVAQGYTIQERLTNVVQYFDIELTADNLKSDAPESNIAPENYYDISESEYILLDENENEIISGCMDDIRNYIENNL